MKSQYTKHFKLNTKNFQVYKFNNEKDSSEKLKVLNLY